MQLVGLMQDIDTMLLPCLSIVLLFYCVFFNYDVTAGRPEVLMDHCILKVKCFNYKVNPVTQLNQCKEINYNM